MRLLDNGMGEKHKINFQHFTLLVFTLSFSDMSHSSDYENLFFVVFVGGYAAIFCVLLFFSKLFKKRYRLHYKCFLISLFFMPSYVLDEGVYTPFILLVSNFPSYFLIGVGVAFLLIGYLLLFGLLKIKRIITKKPVF